MPEKQKANTACVECGMPVMAADYHPYAACLMYKGCQDAYLVQQNIDAVRYDCMKIGQELEKHRTETEQVGWDKMHPETTVAPPKLGPSDIRNFQTLTRAFKNKDVCLVSSVRKLDDKPVALCCAVGRVKNPMISILSR